ncbi:MAG: alpha/beta fold hydrolase, partial [Alphaproteobacteria bacterium]
DEVRPLDMRGPAPGMTEDEIDTVHRHNLCVAMFADPARVDAETVRLQRRNVERTRYDTRKFGLRHHISLFLPQVRCPMLMLWGEEDVFSNPTIHPRVERLSALAPHAQTHIVPGAGHWVQQEHPEAVNPILCDFLLDAGTPHPEKR